MSDIRPFLAFAPRPTRAFGDAITSVDVPVQPSPWSPKGSEMQAAAPATIDVEAVRAEAVARGREEGLAETAALRAKLKSITEAMTAYHAARVEKLGDLVAEASCAIVEAWSPTDRRAVFASIIKAWSQRALGAASAKVNPVDVELLADSGLTIDADPAIKPGDIIIRNAQAELSHVWEDRLRELHETIVAAIEESK